MNYKTNRQIIRKLANNADEMTLMFVRTVLMDTSNSVVNDEAKLKEQWPKNHIISAEYWIEAAKRTQKFLDTEGHKE